MADWDAQLQQWEGQLREGRVGSVGGALREHRLAGIPRAIRAPLAAIAWRSGHPLIGIRLLRPFVRPRSTGSSANEREEIEYAACLIRLGGIDEALELIEPISAARFPRVLLVKTFAWAARWEYRKSIPLLRAYLRLEREHDYENTVARANLASALVYERRHLEAESLLRELLHETSQRRWNLLLGITLEVSATNFVNQRKFAMANRLLEKAGLVMEESAGLHRLFVEKWKVLSSFIADPESSPNRRALLSLQKEARARHHWETVRDIERHLAVHQKDERRFLDLYFGTPHESFRSALLREFSPSEAVPDSHLWTGEAKGPHDRVLDLVDGSISSSDSSLKAGQLLHRLTYALSRDRYRPISVVALHRQIHPGEYFNPTSSIHKIHEAIYRLRDFFRRAGVTIAVREYDGQFLLVPSGRAGIRVYSGAPRWLPHSEERRRLEKLRQPFSAPQAAKAIGLSERATQRILLKLKSSGQLFQQGKGPATRYRLA